MNQVGIHLANGTQDIARVISLGCHHHLALEMQADYLSRCPGERYLRLWHQPQDDPRQVIERARQYNGITPHIIPWNEANIETNLSYRSIAESFLSLALLVDATTILHWPALSPSRGYREHAAEWLPAARVADVVDIHAYGSAAQILEICDWYHSVLPDKELLLTEVNPGAGNRFDQGWWAAEYLALTTALLERPWVIAAIGFIWEWHQPDMHLPQTVDWLGQPIEQAVRAASKPERRPNHSNNSNSSGGGNVSTYHLGNIDITDLRNALPRHATARYDGRSLTAIKRIVIHHSASAASTTAEAMARYHVDHHGWPSIGYHFVVTSAGEIQYVNDHTLITYGVSGQNDDTVHICLPGDFTNAPPPEAQLAATRKFIDNYRLAMGQSYPVVAHREIGDSSCPGDTWPSWRGRLVDAAPAVDWRAEAERLRRELEAATATIAERNAAIENYRAYLSNIGRLASAGLQKG